MFCTTDCFVSYLDLIGLAAARIAVLAFNWDTIPALATDMVYYSIASCNIVLAFSSILSNSSMQHIPISDNTKAPDSKTISPVSGSRPTNTVRPTADEPLPDVYNPLFDNEFTHFKI